MTAPQRLLFLCHTLPYPPDGGVWIRSYHLLRLLAESFDVTALCFHRSGDAGRCHDPSSAVTALRQLADVRALPVPQASSRLRLLWDHLRSVLTGRVFTVYKHESPSFRDRLSRSLESGAFDLVHLDSLDLSAYLPLLRQATVVCGHHNVESQLLRKRAGEERGAVRRWYVRHQARLQEEEERRWCGRVAMNVLVSEADRELLRRVVPGARAEVVPNGVDTSFFTTAAQQSTVEGLVFVGGSGWFPNRQGMEFFGREILPRIRGRVDGVPVKWVGRTSEEERVRHASLYGVELTGYVEDIRPYVRRAACYIVPLRVGGGTRLKILDAWAMGKAVVSTSIGCEGLAAVDGENVIIRDTAEGFAEAVIEVLRDPDLRRRLGSNARATVEREYSWEVIGAHLRRLYVGLLDETPGRESR